MADGTDKERAALVHCCFAPRRHAPHWRWISANSHRFHARMPLTEFLRLVPAWLLLEVQNSEPVVDSRVDVLEASPVAALAWCHLSLWSRGSGTRPADRVDAVSEAVR